eukprot:SAG22_NODE_18046_length_294_cov_0.794872_1_plen_25_part_01
MRPLPRLIQELLTATAATLSSIRID